MKRNVEYNMKVYTIGLVFSHDLEKVMLMKKDTAHKPHLAVLHGKLNGCGGEVEPNETPHECMVREAKEEYGVEFHNWYSLCTLIYYNGISVDNPENKVVLHVFRTVASEEQFNAITQQTREQPIAVDVNRVCEYNVIPNIRWLVPAAKYENDLGTISMNMPSDYYEGPFLNRYVPTNL